MKKYIPVIAFFVTVLLLNACSPDLRIVDSGNSKYNIVIPSQATDIEIQAANELQKYIKLSSNVNIEIIVDSENESAYEICLGNTNRTEQINPRVNVKSLEEDGFIIKTNNDKIFILGGSTKGTLYGVYSFLENFIGIKMYTPHVIDIPEKSVISIPDIDIEEIPVIRYRELHLPSARTSQEFCDWHKLHHPSVRAKEYGSFVHTFQHLVPAEKYFKKHPEFFSEINGIRIPDQQLCLSNPDLYELLLRNLKEQMEKKPEAKVWDVSQNDNFGNCTCENCSRADSIYQSPAGLMIEFVNMIAREFPSKTISTLAYQYTRKAPVGIQPEPNVMVVLCTIECDRSKPIADNQNDLFNRDIEEWSKLTDNIKIWDYVVQFSSYTNPFPNFHVLKPNIKLFVNHGVSSLFEQGSGDSWSDFHELKAYVLAKLMWDPNADVDKIIDDFISGYYGKASPFIKEYFDLRQNAVENSSEGLIIYGYPRTGIKSYLTPELLDKYTLLFIKAEESVLNQPEYLKRVHSARIPLEYAILEISKLNLNDDYKIFFIDEDKLIVNDKMKERLNYFVSNANIENILRLHERGLSPNQYGEMMEKYFNEGMVLHKGYQKNVEILSDIHPNYIDKGPGTLTDGITGEANYFFNWLVFEANDLEAIVDLGEEMNITSVSTNFLQEVKSWIWLPNSVEYYVSQDGSQFRKVGEVKKKAKETETGIFTESFKIDSKNLNARYIKVKTNSLINCPKWHIGHNHGNGKAFIFVDEIIIQ